MNHKLFAKFQKRKAVPAKDDKTVLDQSNSSEKLGNH
jgi:hypothetical protein